MSLAVMVAVGHGEDAPPKAAPPAAGETQAGDAKSGEGAKPAAGEWRSLFDGKKLAPWVATEYGGEGEIAVKDGALRIEAGQPMSGITWKGGPLPKSNYELRLEGRKVEGSDFFLALTFPVKESHCSLVLGGWGGGVVGLSSINGFDASENETTLYENFKTGQWYKVRVRVTDAAVQAWLDDERIINVETEGNEFSLRLEVDQNRPLGMSSYMTVGEYRKIEVRELTAAERAAAAESN